MHKIVTMAAAAAILAATTAAAFAGSCTVYQNRDYGGAHWTLRPGDELQMGGGEPMGKTVSDGPSSGRIYYQPSWNDQISSFQVGPGCTITLWQHAGTHGYGARFATNRSYTYVGDGWNDQASWVECYCGR